jgi:hypothetical protein
MVFKKIIPNPPLEAKDVIKKIPKWVRKRLIKKTK